VPAARRAALILTLFILFQLGCQAGLLIPGLAKLRVAFRGGAFLVSLAALVFVTGRGRSHPAALWCVLSLGVLGLGFLNPAMNSARSAAAQIAMNVAILAPVFWVARLAVTPAVLTRVVTLLWLFQSLSAGVGVLQMYYPGRFQPKLSELVEASDVTREGAKIRLADGTQTYRPMGLTDTPGGAAGAGIYAAIFGLGRFLSARSPLVRGAAGGSILIGLFCIYMSQVRSLLVMCGISMAVFAFLFVRRGDIVRAIGVSLLIPAAAVASFVWAAAVGGDATVKRMQTLTADTAGQVYYKNRGHFLEDTVFRLLPEYPLGAGLGRWGMMYTYFGDKRAPVERRALYAEIQLTGWVFDGGVPLILTYSIALLTALTVAYRITVAVPAQSPFAVWAALVLAYDVGAVAITFNYPIFNSQGGMEFWLLNATLYAAYRSTRPAAARGPAGPALARPQPAVIAP
jgi:hypothetical protein